MGASLGSMDSFVAKYRDYLRRLARRRLGSRLRGKVDESDLVQEAILQAHLARDQFRGKSEPERRVWLRTILESKVAGALRRFSRRRRDVSRETSLERRSPEFPAERWDGQAAATTPSRRVARDEELSRLAQALAALPADQRQAVEMHHLEGLRFAEIATRMGRSRTSVAGLVFRGVRASGRGLPIPRRGDHHDRRQPADNRARTPPVRSTHRLPRGGRRGAGGPPSADRRGLPRVRGGAPRVLRRPGHPGADSGPAPPRVALGSEHDLGRSGARLRLAGRPPEPMRVRARPGDRPGRHGGRLRGEAQDPRPVRGTQDDPFRGPGDPGRRPALPAGGEPRRPA